MAETIFFTVEGMTCPACKQRIQTGLEQVPGVQTITTKFSARACAPITVQKGVPVRWIIQLDAKNLNSCNNEMSIPAYDITQPLQLTPNEYKILSLLSSRPQKSLPGTRSYSPLKAMTTTARTGPLTPTLKMEDNPRSPRYILTVYGVGYRWGGEEKP